MYLTEEEITYTPNRLFHYPIFVSLPLHMRIQYHVRRTEPDEHYEGALAFAMLVKTKNRSDFHSTGNTYVEKPNDFRVLFPNESGLRF